MAEIFKAEQERRLEVGYETLPSLKHPEHNEDSILVDEKLGLFGVFDGVGGDNAGEIASRYAAEFVKNDVDRFADDLDFEEMKGGIGKVLQHAHDSVAKAGSENPEHGGMATTASIVKIWEGDGVKKLIIGNVGDSRVYRLRPGGALEHVTLDDSMVRGALMKEGDSEEEARSMQKLLSNIKSTAELSTIMMEMFWYRRNVVDQALGMRNKVAPRLYGIEDLEPGDIILLATDGVYENMTDTDIEQILRDHASPQEAAKKLAEQAREISTKSKAENFRAKKDDMSAVVLGF